jgi:hypothetical protein
MIFNVVEKFVRYISAIHDAYGDRSRIWPFVLGGYYGIWIRCFRSLLTAGHGTQKNQARRENSIHYNSCCEMCGFESRQAKGLQRPSAGWIGVFPGPEKLPGSGVYNLDLTIRLVMRQDSGR